MTEKYVIQLQAALTRLIDEHVVEDNAVEASEYVHPVVMHNCRVTEPCYILSHLRLIQNVPLSTFCARSKH